MGNILLVPVSGIISFDNRDFPNDTIPPLSASARLSYDGTGGLSVTSHSASAATEAIDIFSVYGSQGKILSVTNSLTGNEFSISGDGTFTGNIEAGGQILSAGLDLFDIFLTSDTDSQTLSYNVTGENLTISNGNTVNLTPLSYRNIEDPTSMLQTIQQFAHSYSGPIYPGYNVTLYNGRVYTFAGIDKNNPNHYLEVNANPYMPIYREVALSGNQTEIIDTFYLGDFKTARYNLQIETSFSNDIYYSEINVVGSVQTSTGVASEYGQIFTNQLILGYDVNISFNNLQFIILYNADMTEGHKLIIKGHRTNFYKI